MKHLVSQCLVYTFQSVETCKNCLSGEKDTLHCVTERCLLQSQNLNKSQDDVVSSCLNMIKCGHSDIKLIWGPPGTGKTKTLACLLFCLLKLQHRSLACAPTNTAILQVAERLHGLVQSSLDYKTYGLGDIVLMGNKSRMRLNSCQGLLDVFLDHRVENLAKCFSPFSGWKHSVESMIHLLEDPKKEYSLYGKESDVNISLEDFVMEKYIDVARAFRAYKEGNLSNDTITLTEYLKLKRNDVFDAFQSKQEKISIWIIELFIEQRFEVLTKDLKFCMKTLYTLPYIFDFKKTGEEYV